jgi:hypothetical protein
MYTTAPAYTGVTCYCQLELSSAPGQHTRGVHAILPFALSGTWPNTALSGTWPDKCLAD